MNRSTGDRGSQLRRVSGSDMREALGDGVILAFGLCLIWFCLLYLIYGQIILNGFPIAAQAVLMLTALAILALGIDRTVTHVQRRPASSRWGRVETIETLGDALILAFGVCFLFFCALPLTSDSIVLVSPAPPVEVVLTLIAVGVASLGLKRLSGHCLRN